LRLYILFAKKKAFFRRVLLLIPAHWVGSKGCEAANVCQLRQAAVFETIVTICFFFFLSFLRLVSHNFFPSSFRVNCQKCHTQRNSSFFLIMKLL
jgi:hypothetical protein